MRHRLAAISLAALAAGLLYALRSRPCVGAPELVDPSELGNDVWGLPLLANAKTTTSKTSNHFAIDHYGSSDGAKIAYVGPFHTHEVWETHGRTETFVEFAIQPIEKDWRVGLPWSTPFIHGVSHSGLADQLELRHDPSSDLYTLVGRRLVTKTGQGPLPTAAPSSLWLPWLRKVPPHPDDLRKSGDMYENYALTFRLIKHPGRHFLPYDKPRALLALALALASTAVARRAKSKERLLAWQAGTVDSGMHVLFRVGPALESAYRKASMPSAIEIVEGTHRGVRRELALLTAFAVVGVIAALVVISGL